MNSIWNFISVKPLEKSVVENLSNLLLQPFSLHWPIPWSWHCLVEHQGSWNKSKFVSTVQGAFIKDTGPSKPMETGFLKTDGDWTQDIPPS